MISAEQRLIDELACGGAPFALLCRSENESGAVIELLRGELHEVPSTAGLPDTPTCARDSHDLLAILPYRVVGERGFAHRPDAVPISYLRVTQQFRLDRERFRDAVPDRRIEVADGDFDLGDTEYAELVARVIAEEIGRGAGANFVLRRTWQGRIQGWDVRTGLALFARLLAGERSAYWTFLVYTGDRMLIGASPERHVSLDRGQVVMTPISGTYRYPDGGPTTGGVLNFLADGKEANELYMVLDEELKMMCQLCDDPYVRGPELQEMAHLAHTRYVISGHSDRDYREVLRATLLAPTVTGSPLENACRVIARFEPDGRGYYAGVLALIGRDERGARRMDSAIMIRTADIDRSGGMRIGVGATVVRDSDPAAEAQETRAKAAGLLNALQHNIIRPSYPDVGGRDAVRRALAARNRPLAPLWLEPAPSSPEHAGRTAVIIDGEDSFTAMGARLLRALGFAVTVTRFDAPLDPLGFDLAVVGPGPGDPRDLADPKVARLRALTHELLASEKPFFSVCLGHQVLSGVLGLPVRRRSVSNQGVLRVIDLFGNPEPVYFYNAFEAHSATDFFETPHRTRPVAVSRDPRTGEVHALRGDGFASLQFHPASVMSRNGSAIVAELVSGLLTPAELSAAAVDKVGECSLN
ncbi:anthranilate synthase family protein [Nocardia sp. NPDC058058]|uniref:anthranilate synthase family protein n=1 Tax=Nocardia sp. NPDC058058 TaxID=3346317 RepID=UPI0036DDD920